MVPTGKNRSGSASRQAAASCQLTWARYAEGTDERGEPIEVVDRLAGLAHAGGPAPA